MKLNPLHQGRFTTEATGLGPVTREMAYARARELALDAGRLPHDVSQRDYEQAKRELTGESDPDRQDAILDAPPATRRRDGFALTERDRARRGIAAQVADEPGRCEADRNQLLLQTTQIAGQPRCALP